MYNMRNIFKIYFKLVVKETKSHIQRLLHLETHAIALMKHTLYKESIWNIDQFHIILNFTKTIKQREEIF